MADVPLELQESRVFQLRLRNNDLHRIPDAKLSGSGELGALEFGLKAKSSISIRRNVWLQPPSPTPYSTTPQPEDLPAQISPPAAFLFSHLNPSSSLPPSLSRDLWQIPLVLKSRGCSH